MVPGPGPVNVAARGAGRVTGAVEYFSRLRLRTMSEDGPKDSPPARERVARGSRPVDRGNSVRPLERPRPRPRTRASASRRPPAPEPELGKQLDDLYNEVLELSRGPSTAAREQALEKAFMRLRALQQAEALQFRQQFEASLNAPLGAGRALLARVRELRRELENSAPANPAPPEADGA